MEQGVTPVTGTFTWRAAEQSDFDKGTYVGTESTPQNTVELAPGQSSGAYISKIYDSISEADWNAIIIDMGGPYNIEVGKTDDDKAGAAPPFTDTTAMDVLLHFNNEPGQGRLNLRWARITFALQMFFHLAPFFVQFTSTREIDGGGRHSQEPIPFSSPRGRSTPFPSW